ncbi:hypothetical protein DFAR_630060 [Desulfarculales bacterium]
MPSFQRNSVVLPKTNKIATKRGYVHAQVRTNGFSCWTQFVNMLFYQLARAVSLKEICQDLSCYLGKLFHRGVSADPKRPLCPTPTSIGSRLRSEPCFSKSESASMPKAS